VLYFVKYFYFCYSAEDMKKQETYCPITQVAELLSDRWTMLVLYQLNRGAKRFCDLERALDGISTRTLTLKLKRLAEQGLVIKNTDGLYETTEQGRGLKLVENAMRRYEAKYL